MRVSGHFLPAGPGPWGSYPDAESGGFKGLQLDPGSRTGKDLEIVATTGGCNFADQQGARKPTCPTVQRCKVQDAANSGALFEHDPENRGFMKSGTDSKEADDVVSQEADPHSYV